MSCICCFISDEYQKKLKQKCFGLKRFEDRLIKYKQLFVNEVNNLKSVSECSCMYVNLNKNYIKWTHFDRCKL